MIDKFKICAKIFANTWVSQWNSLNLDAVLSHYSDDFELHSPLIAKLGFSEDGVLIGKDNIKEYWIVATSRVTKLNFEIVEVFEGVDSVTIYYINGPRKAAETFIFHGNMVIKAYANYVE
jgi:hypothetical protein